MWRWRWKEARARAIENWFSIQCKIKFDTSRRRVVVAFLLLGSLREWLASSWLWQERRKRCYCWHETKKYMQCTSIVQYGLKMTQLSMEESWKNRNIDELSSSGILLISEWAFWCRCGALFSLHNCSARARIIRSTTMYAEEMQWQRWGGNMMMRREEKLSNLIRN